MNNIKSMEQLLDEFEVKFDSYGKLYNCNALGSIGAEMFQYLGKEINNPELLENFPEWAYTKITRSWTSKFEGLYSEKFETNIASLAARHIAVDVIEVKILVSNSVQSIKLSFPNARKFAEQILEMCDED